MPFNAKTFIPGAASFFGGLFGDSGGGYDSAMDEYSRWNKMATSQQQPFYNAGSGAIGNYQSWLDSQKNPTEFVNQTMQNYNASPYSQYLQQQNIRTGQNAGSASGLSGSTALMQQLQQNANNISSQDMNQWLQNVLGINTQYGQGQQNLMNMGQNSANSLSNLYNTMGTNMGEAAYGKQAGQNQDFWNMIGGAGQMFGGLLGL